MVSVSCDSPLVQVQNVIGDSEVVLRSVDVLNNEDAVETGEDGCLEFDLFGDLFELVIASVDRVSGCEDRDP